MQQEINKNVLLNTVSKMSSSCEFILIILAIVTTHAASNNPLIRNEDVRIPTTKAADFRLPRDIKAVEYTITLHPMFVNATFNGKCSFRFEALQAVDEIVLHSSGLIIDDNQVAIYEESTNTMFHVMLEESGDNRDFLRLILNGTLTVGATYRADFNNYLGILYNDNHGFYLGEYTSANGETRTFATTQFESTGARKVFPCMDEPEYKAMFTLSLIRDAQYSSTSNMPIFTTENVDGRKKDTFYKSLPMSTYLLAFTISDFEYIFDVNQNWIYARPEAIHAGYANYALSVSYKVLEEITDFTNVWYTWPHMEQIAFPDRYFSAGAMENWGHVTYKDSLLLFDPEVSTTSNRRSILNTISHEFGHQWFGNLVTPKWWGFLWLSEGFATYLSYIGARVGAPSWIIDQFFTTSSLHNALDRDSSINTRPMNQEVGSPSEIAWMFDFIAYDKSACIIRMVESFMTTSAFKRGLENYLHEMAYQAAEPQDLYIQLANEISLPNSLPPNTTLEEVMVAWTDIAGYPLVSVRKWSSQAFVMEQQHFVTNGIPRDIVWPIPINWAVQGNANFENVAPNAWILANQSVVEYGEIPENAWYIINKQQTGYYRVNYDMENWRNLVNQLINNYDEIHVLNRAQLLEDSFYLARYDRLHFVVPLNMTRYIKGETYYAPLSVFYKMLTFLNKFMARERNYKDFQDYMVSILQGQYDFLGSDPNELDNDMNILNRIRALEWIAKKDFSSGEFRTKALSVVKTWMEGSSTIVPDLHSPYFCAAMAVAEEADWEQMYNRFVKANSTMRSRYLASLGCSETTYIRDKLLSRALDPANGFSEAEVLNAFRSIYRSGSDGVIYIYRYIVENFYKLKGKTNISSLLDGVCDSFTTFSDLAMVIKNAETFEEVDGIFKSAIQRVQQNYNWGSKYIGYIASWFANEAAM